MNKELREKVAKAMKLAADDASPVWCWYDEADAAISIIRPAVLEEAAKVNEQTMVSATLLLASGERVEVSPHMVEWVNFVLRCRAAAIRALAKE